ncbi:MAG: hypothetical protein U0929_07155 [Planctomycetaceae bacterium]
MKTILGFREDSKGFYIDLEDQFSAIAVNRSTGDLLLDEGDGNDRFHGAVILQRSNPRFQTRSGSGKMSVWLVYGKNDNKHFIGNAIATWAAIKWIIGANQAMEGKAPQAKRNTQGSTINLFNIRRHVIKHRHEIGFRRNRSTKLLMQLVREGSFPQQGSQHRLQPLKTKP